MQIDADLFDVSIMNIDPLGDILITEIDLIDLSLNIKENCTNIPIVAFKTYRNSELLKEKILEENKNKSGIYR
jgi:hypothetical protein